MIVSFDGTDYRVDDGQIVNNRTNIIVCSTLANDIARQFGIKLPKQVVESTGRIDINHLNRLVSSRIQK